MSGSDREWPIGLIAVVVGMSLCSIVGTFADCSRSQSRLDCIRVAKEPARCDPPGEREPVKP